MTTPPATPSATPSAMERARLADALETAGPDAPTLCTGWTARDLAAHLAARERRPDSTPGLLLRPLAGWTEHVRAGYARRPYPELLHLIRTGPPATSPFALPGADAAGNLAEHFVHCEDVRRGDPAVPPRPADLPEAVDAALWRFLETRGRGMFRRARTGVVLATPDGRGTVAVRGRAAARLVAEPGELVLVAFGRGARALVHRTGDDSALAALDAADLSV
jgi:uncharacterized protein (TIGR03085 family)